MCCQVSFILERNELLCDIPILPEVNSEQREIYAFHSINLDCSLSLILYGLTESLIVW